MPVTNAYVHRSVVSVGAVATTVGLGSIALIVLRELRIVRIDNSTSIYGDRMDVGFLLILIAAAALFVGAVCLRAAHRMPRDNQPPPPGQTATIDTSHLLRSPTRQPGRPGSVHKG
jgi:hypothetical protein